MTSCELCNRKGRWVYNGGAHGVTHSCTACRAAFRDEAGEALPRSAWRRAPSDPVKVAGVIVTLPDTVRVTTGKEGEIIQTDDGRTIRSVRAVWRVRAGCDEGQGRVVAEFRAEPGESHAMVRAYHRAAEEAGLEDEAQRLLEEVIRRP